MAFIVGFVAGLFANWVFSVMNRLLPKHLIRFGASVGEIVMEQENDEFSMWVAPVRVHVPLWRRTFMEPMSEPWICSLRLDSNLPVRGKWVLGDTYAHRFQVTGADSIPLLLFTKLYKQSKNIALSDGLRAIEPGDHCLTVEIRRLLDSSLVIGKKFVFCIEDGELIYK